MVNPSPRHMRDVRVQMSPCDKVIETKKRFSLFCTVFAIWKHLEAFGSIWKHLEADCFRYFPLFSLFCIFFAILHWFRYLEADCVRICAVFR